MQRQLFEYHPVLGYRFIPGLKARVPHEAGGYLVQVNNQGFRCQRDFALKKSPGTFRVLLFGDSFSAGDGVSNRQRYGDLLETLLPNTEVFNFALPGTGTDQQYLAFKEFAQDVECDVIVAAVLVENIRRNTARYRPFADENGKQVYFPKPFFVRSTSGELELEGVPVAKAPLTEAELGQALKSADQGGRLPVLRKAINRFGPRAKQLAQRLTGYQPVPGYNRADDPDWLLMRSILALWSSACHAPFLVFPIPLYQHVEGTASAEPYRRRFRELERETRISLCDPFEHLDALPASDKRRLRFESDVHPTPFAHEQLARALVPALSQLRQSPSQGSTT
jgi:carbamoyltransferase